MEKTICIIPARGGSKRIPRKNILPLNGIPLLSYTIRTAVKANVFDKIIVSTEDKEIKELALSENVLVDDRPLNMSGDKVTKVQVVDEYLKRTNAKEKYNNITTLLPTCPFRNVEDIRKPFTIFMENKNKIPFLIGVSQYDFPIQLALAERDINSMKMINMNGYLTTRSQDIEKRFHPNGSIYMASIEAFLEKGTFFNEEMLSYVMPPERSYDIDYPYQFQIAEAIAIANNIKP